LVTSATAAALLDAVDREPDEVAVAAERLASGSDPVTASIAWRAAGIAHRMLGRVTAALAALDASVAAAERAGDARLAALARTSRAAPRFMAGDMRGGLDDLDVALTVLAGPDRGIAVFQRAQYLDVVEDPGAAAAFDEAIELLTDAPGHTKYLAHARANRGLHHANGGRLDEARADLTAALDVWDGIGLDALAATVVHNLGVVEMLAGDFVAALDRFEAARRRSSALGGDAAASGRDYCDALLAAGLSDEARERAEELADRCDGSGDLLAGAELRLLAAHAALQTGDTAATTRLATAARAQFQDAGRPGWAAQAALALAQARAAAPADDGTGRDIEMTAGATTDVESTIDELDALALDLRHHGWSDARAPCCAARRGGRCRQRRVARRRPAPARRPRTGGQAGARVETAAGLHRPGTDRRSAGRPRRCPAGAAARPRHRRARAGSGRCGRCPCPLRAPRRRALPAGR
jgi:tetratricopeptide (TPR) repeat protein